MKTRIHWLLAFLLVLSMVLTACGGGAAPVDAPPAEVVETEEAAPEPTEAPEVEPTEAEEMEEEVQPASESELDAAFSAFLGAMEGYNVMKMDKFVELMAEDSKPFLLDVREVSESEEKGHIEGAVLIPLRELGQNLDKLPAMDSQIVSYCGSGWRCTIAMAALGAMGWDNITALKDNSFGGWVEAGYATVDGVPPEAEVLNAAEPNPSLAMTFDETLSAIPDGWGVITVDDLQTELVENPDLILIDVRQDAEIEEKGSIEAENSAHVPLESMIDMKSDWPADKDAEIVVYCGSGHRSTIAMTILWSYGYTNVRSMKGGFAAWVEAGYPVVGGTEQAATGGELDLDAAFQRLLDSMVKYNTMALADLNTALGEEPPPYLLDVREVSEAEEKGHIENAYLIPLRELGDNWDKLPSFDTSIVSYCGSGWRCTIAMTYLVPLGWEDTKALTGGSFGGWVEEGYSVVEGVPPEAEALNAAEPDEALAAHFAEVLAGIPEGWGVVTVDNLAVELTENEDLILIDVRQPSEREEKGVIEFENQVAVPLEEFIANKGEWPTDTDATIVAYCGSGHRSTMAMSMLWAYGYTNVRSMKGGFAAWVEAGYPVAELAAQ